MKKVEISEELKARLRKQGYKLVGNHSAIKPCYWLRESLMRGRTCYKHKFYGIASWRCIQMTPAVVFCTNQCIYCWRVQPGDVGIKWKQIPEKDAIWDPPDLIVKESIRMQKVCMQGYRGVNAIPERLKEAFEPKHAAISLSGEPTLYPMIGELVEEFWKRGLTTFIVTNGTLPERIANLKREHTQLYITVPAPNKEIYYKVTRSLLSDAWERLNKTLDLIPSLKCYTVIRLTLVKGLNMVKPEEYAKLLKGKNPTYIECKAYMHVGCSRRRLKGENMPTHEEIREFAKKVSEASGYPIIAESKESRVVLLSKLDKPIKLA